MTISQKKGLKMEETGFKMKKQIERVLEKNEFTGKTWMGYPTIKDNNVYINAKGRDLDIVKMFRDIFGGTANAGSVKVISKFLRRKENGFYLVLSVDRMEEILNGMGD